MKQGYKSDILMPRNALDRVSEKLDFENFPGSMPPDPLEGQKFPLTASRLTKLFAMFQASPISRTMHGTEFLKNIGKSEVKTGLEKYYSIKTSHTGVNNMWILKNSTNLLSSSGHLGVHRATSIQTLDFSTLYTSIPHDLLKSRMNSIINNAFKHKNAATRYTHIKVCRNKSYFTSDPLDGDNKYTADDICKMIEFLVDNMYVGFSGQLFRQMVGILMGTNCVICFSSEIIATI